MRKVSKKTLLLNYHVRDEKMHVNAQIHIYAILDMYTFVSRLHKLGSSRQKDTLEMTNSFLVIIVDNVFH